MVEEAVVYFFARRWLETCRTFPAASKEGRIVRNDTLESVRRVEDWFKRTQHLR